MLNLYIQILFEESSQKSELKFFFLKDAACQRPWGQAPLVPGYLKNENEQKRTRCKSEVGYPSWGPLSRIEGLRDLETKDAISGVESRLDLSPLETGSYP